MQIIYQQKKFTYLENRLNTIQNGLQTELNYSATSKFNFYIRLVRFVTVKGISDNKCQMIILILLLIGLIYS